MMAFLHSIWGPSTSNGWLNKLSIENSTIIEAFCKEGLTNGGFNICSEVPGTVTPLQKLELHPNNINYVSPVSTVALLLLAVFWLCSNVSQGIYWFWLNVPNVVVSGSVLFNAQLRISFFFYPLRDHILSPRSDLFGGIKAFSGNCFWNNTSPLCIGKQIVPLNVF